jgi:hypothetical protein
VKEDVVVFCEDCGERHAKSREWCDAMLNKETVLQCGTCGGFVHMAVACCLTVFDERKGRK